MEALLTLGADICGNLDSEEEFKTFLDDKDFTNRSLLKIITVNELESLFSRDDPKSKNVMDKIFIGKEGSQCDGNIYGYSTFMGILKKKPTRV